MSGSVLGSARPGRTGLLSRAQRGPQSLALRREVAGALVSVAGLAGRPVRDGDGNVIGTVADVVVHWDAGYSPVTGLIVRVGQRRTWLHAADVVTIERSGVRLRVLVAGDRHRVRSQHLGAGAEHLRPGTGRRRERLRRTLRGGGDRRRVGVAPDA